jgi:hypothetical protein
VAAVAGAHRALHPNKRKDGLRQHMEPLEPRILLAADLGLLSAGLSEYLSGAETAIESKAFNQDLPLVGDNLATTGANFLGQLTTALTGAMTGGTPPTTVGGLQTALSGALTAQQIDTFNVTVNGGNPADLLSTIADLKISIDIKELQSVTTGFEFGLKGLPITLEPGTTIEGALDWTLNLDFGFDTAFYVDTTTGVEFDVNVGFEAPDTLHALGDFGLLQVGFSEPAGSSDTHLSGDIVIDLSSGAHAAAATAAAATPAVTLAGQVEMTAVMGAGLTYNSGSNVYESNAPFPTFKSTFAVDDWDVGRVGQLVGSAPTVEFRDIKLDFGEFASDFLGPIFHDIDEVLAPLVPIIDFLNSPAPLIKDIGPLDALLKELSTSGRDTPLDLIEVAGILTGQDYGDDIAEMHKLLDSVQDFHAFVGLLDAAASGNIGLGTFSFDGFDLRLAAGSGGAALPTTIDATTLSQLADELTAGDLSALTQAQRDALQNDEAGFTFPLLSDPTSLAKLLFGQDIVLVEYNIPTISVEIPFELPKIGPIWPIPPVYIVLGGVVGLTIDVGFGFDTPGLRDFADSGNSADILNGFYVVDHDGPEIVFTGGITAGAFGGIAVGPAQIGAQITGGIIADLKLDLNDAAGSTGVQIADGRVHFNEFSDDPGCIFQATGEVSVEVLLKIILPPGADDIFEAIGDAWET